MLETDGYAASSPAGQSATDSAQDVWLQLLDLPHPTARLGLGRGSQNICLALPGKPPQVHIVCAAQRHSFWSGRWIVPPLRVLVLMNGANSDTDIVFGTTTQTQTIRDFRFVRYHNGRVSFRKMRDNFSPMCALARTLYWAEEKDDHGFPLYEVAFPDKPSASGPLWVAPSCGVLNNPYGVCGELAVAFCDQPDALFTRRPWRRREVIVAVGWNAAGEVNSVRVLSSFEHDPVILLLVTPTRTHQLAYSRDEISFLCENGDAREELAATGVWVGAESPHPRHVVSFASGGAVR